MTPPDQTYTDPIAQASTALLAVKPIFWFAGMVAAATMFGSALLNRVESIEHDVQTIKLILCEDKGQDSYCRGTR